MAAFMSPFFYITAAMRIKTPNTALNTDNNIG